MNSNLWLRLMGLVLLLSICAGCCSLERPCLSLKQANLAEGPVIIQRGDHFYLRYRRALEDGRFGRYSVLYVKKTKDAGYYAFSCPISSDEWGNLMERPLALDGLEEFAQAGQIYWLDPDETRHLIPVRREE